MITSLNLITVVEQNRCSIITLFLLPILLLLKVINFLMNVFPPASSVIINHTHRTYLGGKWSDHYATRMLKKYSKIKVSSLCFAMERMEEEGGRVHCRIISASPLVSLSVSLSFSSLSFLPFCLLPSWEDTGPFILASTDRGRVTAVRCCSFSVCH